MSCCSRAPDKESMTLRDGSDGAEEEHYNHLIKEKGAEEKRIMHDDRSGDAGPARRVVCQKEDKARLTKDVDMCKSR
jgi:hypothetical protein